MLRLLPHNVRQRQAVAAPRLAHRYRFTVPGQRWLETIEICGSNSIRRFCDAAQRSELGATVLQRRTLKVLFMSTADSARSCRCFTLSPRADATQNAKNESQLHIPTVHSYLEPLRKGSTESDEGSKCFREQHHPSWSFRFVLRRFFCERNAHCKLACQ